MSAPAPDTRRKKLTKEEKLARKKQLAEERKLKALEQEKQNFRDELRRETIYTQNSRRILDPHWEQICGEITQNDLLESMKCHKQNIDRVFDTKEVGIEQMRRWREEASIQHKRLLDGHLAMIDYLMKIYNFCLKTMKENYDNTVRSLLSNFNDEEDHRSKILKTHQDFYENRQHALNFLLESKYEEEKIDHKNKKLEIEFEAIDQRDNHRERVEYLTNEIISQIHQIRKIFCETTANPKRMKIYEKMRHEDLFSVQDLERLRFEREKYEQELSKLNNALTDIELEYGHELQKLRYERKRAEVLYWEMKEKTKKSMKVDEKCLREMAMVSDRAMKRLNEFVERGDSLLKLSRLCAKLEYPQERLFLVLHKENPKNQEGLLINFWTKVSQASYSRDLVKAEKKRLLQENSHLQAMLREYCVQSKVRQNLSMLGFDKNGSKSGPVAQEACVIPQIRKNVLKMKAKHGLVHKKC